MTHRNSVAALRVQELAKARRPFLARGSKIVRCDACLLAQANCMCALRPSPSGRSAFVFVMYHGEVFKPSNTGRLIADVVLDNHAIQWARTEPNEHLLALLADERYAPMLVFPHQYAEAERCIHRPEQLDAVQQGKTPLFIMLDGTWREAKKMFRSPYFAQLPVIGLQPSEGSQYQLREAAHTHQLCTAEVGIELLKLAGDEQTASDLQQYFETFRRHYLVCKASSLGKPSTPPTLSTLFGVAEDGTTAS